MAIKSIAAIIVTYNRKELLIKNLHQCFLQKRALDKIILIDNHSTDGTKEYICDELSEKELNYINYIYLESNTGGSGGFSYGVKYAYEKGYDYIWLMDDDGYPKNADTLLQLTNFVEDNNLQEKEFMLNSLVLCDDENLSFGAFQGDSIIYKRSEVQGDRLDDFVNAFNGTLISRALISKIGHPRKDYFIKGDEKEYLLRAKKNKANIYTVTNSLYFHPVPLKWDTARYIMGKLVMNNIEDGWKEYYNMRNVCHNTKMYEKNSLIKRTRFMLVRIAKVIIFGEKKGYIVRMILTGYWHAILGKTGIYYLPSGKKER